MAFALQSVPDMKRTPREQVEAVLANLAMAARCLDTADNNDEEGWAFESGKCAAFHEAISLIRTECSSILNPTE